MTSHMPNPLPWHTDPHVRYYLLDATGRLVADFNPPYLRLESERAQSEANARLAALQSQYYEAVEAALVAQGTHTWDDPHNRMKIIFPMETVIFTTVRAAIDAALSALAPTPSQREGAL